LNAKGAEASQKSQKFFEVFFCGFCVAFAPFAFKKKI